MAVTAHSEETSALSFSPATFAKLSPVRYLLAHLSQDAAKGAVRRPNGRLEREFRPVKLNTNSLTHADGSAVVRIGDTAVVCGVRGELLRAEDADMSRVTRPGREVQDLGLLVPNIELATGCSPAHLPGQPPSESAQTLSSRIVSALSAADMVDVEDLRVWHDAGEELQNERVVKAYWTLYVDLVFISIDGNPFDAAWMAILAALQKTRLPHAWWDPDQEKILCDPRAARARGLQLTRQPVAVTFGVFTDGKRTWVLSDPNDFEQGLCRESVTLLVEEQYGQTKMVKSEKGGGTLVQRNGMRELVELAGKRYRHWLEVRQ